jgi:hypothetical protein
MNSNISTELSTKQEATPFAKGVLPAVFCRRISTGKYFVKIGEHEYEVYNHGYYAPDKCIWWEATNLKTNEADFHEHTKSQLLKTMQRELS